MFDINLLRKRAVAEKRRSVIRNIIYIEALITMLTLLLLSSLYANNSFKIRLCKNEIRKMTDKISAIETVDLNLEGESWSEASQKLSLINNILENRILWAKKMDGLKKAMPPQMWIKNLHVKEEEDSSGISQKLVIRGSLLLRENNEETNLIQQFVKNLKNSSSFMEGIEEIDLDLILVHKGEGAYPIMDFSISCYFFSGREYNAKESN